MLNLTPHHRFHVPNGLAMLAAVMLLVSSVVGFETGPDMASSGLDSTPSVKAESTDTTELSDSVSKRRGLNLGFLLFRRG